MDCSGVASNDVVYERLGVDHVSGFRERVPVVGRARSSRGGRCQVLDQVAAEHVRQHGDVARQDVHGCLVGRARALVNTPARGSKTPFGPERSGRWALPSAGQRDRWSVADPPTDDGGTRMRRRTQLSIDLPARHVFVIGVEGRLDAVSGVRLLRLLDTRLTLTSAAARPTRRVLIDLTGLDGADSGGVRSLDRARRTAELHGVALALITDGGSGHTCRRVTGTISAPSPPSGRSATPCRIRRTR